MNQSSYHFTFKLVEKSQRNLIHEWLKQDYIRHWIHGHGLQNTLNSLDTFLAHVAEGKIIDRQTALMQHWLGYEEEKPFVYLLTSNVLKEASDAYRQYCLQDGLAITLDIFIIDPSYLGRGIASKVIKEFLLSRFSDISEVLIDPETSNTRAIHVYEKVGFKKIATFIAPWHPVEHCMMRLDMSDIKSP